MNDQNQDDLVPQQHASVAKNLHAVHHAETAEEADELFVLAKERLLAVNDWKITAGDFGAAFHLTDAAGHEALRPARKGDYIRIAVPGPGHSGGHPDDWVRIEVIRYDDFPDDNRESLGLRVRPSAAPGSEDPDPDHFFTDEATSTFVIERIGATVMARYHGRNEVPNTGGNNLPDKVRNTLVALGALAGFSDVQWRNLIEGFIRPPEAS